MTFGTTPITPGSGATVAVDDIGGDLYQLVKLFDGRVDGTDGAPVDATRGLTVDTRRMWTRILVSPSFSTSVYAAGDNMGGAQTVPGAIREAGAGAVVRAVTVTNAQPTLAGDLWLVFADRALTGTATDQAPFAPAASDLPFITAVQVVLAADLHVFAANGVATYSGLALPLRANSGVDARMYLVAQGPIDLTTNADLEVVLHVEQF